MSKFKQEEEGQPGPFASYSFPKESLKRKSRTKSIRSQGPEGLLLTDPSMLTGSSPETKRIETSRARKGRAMTLANKSKELRSTEIKSSLKRQTRPHQDASLEQPKHVGKSSKQIMMKNPIVASMKKFFLKDDKIRSMVTSMKFLLEIIETIKPLKDLCNPSKHRIRSLLQVQEVESGNGIPLSDTLHLDLFYVIYGSLEVQFEKANPHLDGQDETKVHLLPTNSYIDHLKVKYSKHYRKYQDFQLSGIVNACHDQSDAVTSRRGSSVFGGGGQSVKQFNDFKLLRKITSAGKRNSQQYDKNSLRHNKTQYLPIDTRHMKEGKMKSTKESHIDEEDEPAQSSKGSLKGANHMIGLLKIEDIPQPLMSKFASQKFDNENEVDIVIDSAGEQEEQKDIVVDPRSLKSPRENFQGKSSNKDFSRSESIANGGKNLLVDLLSKKEETLLSDSCIFVRMPFHIYSSYANCPLRNEDNMIQAMCDVLPRFSDITKTKKFNLLNSFEEIEFRGGLEGYKPGHVLEREGHMTGYLYLVLRGYIHLFKKVPGLYTNPVRVRDPSQDSSAKSDTEPELIRICERLPLDKFQDPVHSHTEDLGVHIGSMGGKVILVGEDSALFKQNGFYSMVAGENLLLMRYPVKDALQAWPAETQKQLRADSLQKYMWIFDRIKTLNSQLSQNVQNSTAVELSLKMKQRTEMNYPLASTKARRNLKEANLKIAGSNQKKYLGINNRRFQFFQKPLTGYVDDSMLKRLQRQKESIFSKPTNNYFIKSEPLSKLRQKEQAIALQKQREEKVEEPEPRILFDLGSGIVSKQGERKSTYGSPRSIIGTLNTQNTKREDSSALNTLNLNFKQTMNISENDYGSQIHNQSMKKTRGYRLPVSGFATRQGSQNTTITLATRPMSSKTNDLKGRTRVSSSQFAPGILSSARSICSGRPNTSRRSKNVMAQSYTKLATKSRKESALIKSLEESNYQTASSLYHNKHRFRESQKVQHKEFLLKGEEDQASSQKITAIESAKDLGSQLLSSGGTLSAQNTNVVRTFGFGGAIRFEGSTADMTRFSRSGETGLKTAMPTTSHARSNPIGSHGIVIKSSTAGQERRIHQANDQNESLQVASEGLNANATPGLTTVSLKQQDGTIILNQKTEDSAVEQQQMIHLEQNLSPDLHPGYLNSQIFHPPQIEQLSRQSEYGREASIKQASMQGRGPVSLKPKSAVIPSNQFTNQTIKSSRSGGGFSMTIKSRKEPQNRKTTSGLKGNFSITNTFSNKLQKKMSGIGQRAPKNLVTATAQRHTLYSHVVLKEGQQQRQPTGDIIIPYQNMTTLSQNESYTAENHRRSSHQLYSVNNMSTNQQEAIQHSTLQQQTPSSSQIMKLPSNDRIVKIPMSSKQIDL